MILGALGLPSTALAAPSGSSGGSGSGGSGTGGSGGSGLVPPPGQQPPVQNGNVTVTATGSGVTIQSRASATLRRTMSFSGLAPASASGDMVEIERLGHQTHWRWAATTTATVTANGSFSAAWVTNHIGRFSIRAVLEPPATPTPSVTIATPPVATAAMTVTVYRPSLATEYGPGFYGSRTACGQKLTRSMLGVANRTLKCGMLVAIDFKGKTLIVPVIDRGPYANGADWDLTMATGRALGIDGTATIGAVSLPNH